MVLFACFGVLALFAAVVSAPLVEALSPSCFIAAVAVSTVIT